MPENEQTLAALDEAVRGENGLQHTVRDLRTEVTELSKFRSTIIGVIIAVNGFAPVIWFHLLK